MIILVFAPFFLPSTVGFFLVLVFVDIQEDTLSMDVSKIADAITENTKVIVTVHYARIGCVMENILEIASRQNMMVAEVFVLDIRFLIARLK